MLLCLYLPELKIDADSYVEINTTEAEANTSFQCLTTVTDQPLPSQLTFLLFPSYPLPPGPLQGPPNPPRGDIPKSYRVEWMCREWMLKINLFGVCMCALCEINFINLCFVVWRIQRHNVLRGGGYSFREHKTKVIFGSTQISHLYEFWWQIDT